MRSALRDSSVTGARDLRDGRSPRHPRGLVIGPSREELLALSRTTLGEGGHDDAQRRWSPLAVLTRDVGRDGAGEARRRKRRPPGDRSAGPEEARETPRPAIRVLQNPYDISSFYRSGESPLGPWAGLPQTTPRYRIAASIARTRAATPARRTAGRPSGRAATARRGPRPSGPTAARSARTATSSWPCRSSRRSARSAARSPGY